MNEQYISRNRAENITAADATALLKKLSTLGLRFGPLFLDDNNAGGGNEENFMPISEVELDGQTAYCFIAYAGGNWHNIAMMKLEWGAGTIEDFKQCYQKVYFNGDANAAILNIPGVAKAVAKIIERI